IVGLLAVLKAGGAYVPLDPLYPKTRLVHMIEDVQVAVVLSKRSLLSVLLSVKVPVLWFDDAGQLEGRPDTASLDVSTAGPANALYVIYTSGSTGEAKGVSISHSTFLNLIYWYIQEFALTAQDRILLCTSFGFDLTQKNIFAPLIVGGTLSLLE